MKRPFIFLILLPAMVLVLTSCNLIANPSQALSNIVSGGESGKITQMSTDILNCFTENDKETFKNLFCEQVRNSPGFDEQVDKAFEYCKGTVYFTEHTISTLASGGSARRDGRQTEWSVSAQIPYFRVSTDIGSGKSEFYHYAIYYGWNIIYEPDQTREGLTGMKIYLLNVDSMTVGEWITLYD